MLTSREATEAPRQGSRSPLSPTEVTESATARLFLILSALLCSVNNVDLRLLYRLRLLSRSPHNAQHSTSWGERERGPLLWTRRTRCHARYIYIYTAGTRYCACAALRANVAGRIGNRFNPAESAFLVPSATSLTLAP